MTDIIILGILLILVIIGIRSSIKHFKGEGGCCGGSSGPRVRKMKLKEIRETKTFKIEGMSCDNCKKRIENELNSMDQVNAKVSLKRKEVVVKLGIHMEDSAIIQKIEKLGYRVII